jgi:uncharacterized Zn finger protein
VTNHALKSISLSENSMKGWLNRDQQRTLTDGDDVSVELKGKYTLQITNHVLQLMTNGNDIEVVWHSDKKKRKKNNRLNCISKELVKVLLHEMMKKNITPG